MCSPLSDGVGRRGPLVYQMSGLVKGVTYEEPWVHDVGLVSVGEWLSNGVMDKKDEVDDYEQVDGVV